MNKERRWWEKGKLYYVCLFITIILSYGFTLTHFSVGVDDESFTRYFQEGRLIAQGRVQSYFIMKVINIFEYLPVWRELLGLILMVIGLMLLGNLFYKLSGGKFGAKEETIFSCIAISFPYIANSFIFSMSVISIGLNILFPAIIIYLLVDDTLIKNKVYRWVMLGCVTICGMLGEHIIVNTGIFFIISLILIVLYMDCDEKRKMKRVIVESVKALFLLIFGLICRYVLVKVVQTVEEISAKEYSSGHIVYNFSDGLSSMFQSLWEVLKKWVWNYTDDRAIILFRIFVVVIIAIAIIQLVKYKNKILVLSLLALLVVTLIWPILTGNVNLPRRICCYMGIPIGFGIALFYHILRKNLYKYKKAVNCFYGIACFYIIFYQTIDINSIFYADYLSCEQDRRIMERIGEDLKAYDMNEVVFVGLPEKIEDYSDITDIYSLFLHDRMNSINDEISSGRIYRYFNMNGYNIQSPGDVDYQEVFEVASDMGQYPTDGYIKETENYLIVKLGESPWEIIEVSEQKKIENSGLVKSSYDQELYEDGCLTISGWAFINKVSSNNCEIAVVLEDDKQMYYKMRTQSVERKDVTAAFSDGCDYDMSGFTMSIDIDSCMEAGGYSVKLLIECEDDLYLMDICEITIE